MSASGSGLALELGLVQWEDSLEEVDAAEAWEGHSELLAGLR